MGQKLTEEQLKQLHTWLEGFSINHVVVRNKMHRDFSDGVIMAIILKDLHPKLIDLHNYPRSCSIKFKRSNWETLNNKVFKKLGIQQSSVVLDEISKSQPGCIEQLLYEIIQFELAAQKKLLESQTQDNEIAFTINDDVIMVNLNKQIGDAIVKVKQKMILFSIYEQTLRQTREKDKKIAALCQKVIHLENIIELKTERIQELCGQLTKSSVHNYIKRMSENEGSAKSINPSGDLL